SDEAGRPGLMSAAAAAAAASQCDVQGPRSNPRPLLFPLESTRFPPEPPPMSQLAYRRILLKLSGEALMGGEDYGIDPKVIQRLAAEIIEAQEAGAEIALVIGG